jgi:hypothetical protein
VNVNYLNRAPLRLNRHSSALLLRGGNALFRELHHQRETRSLIRNSLIATLATWALFTIQTRTEAQTRSFTISGAGLATRGLPLPGEAPRPHWSLGVGTRLGGYFGNETIQTDWATFNSDGSISGEFGSGSPYIFTAATGDKLAVYYGRTDYGAESPGTFQLVPVPALGPGWFIGYFIAEFVPYDPLCTGVFAGVTGGWTMYAVSAPFLLGSSQPTEYSWSGTGQLTFNQGG